MDSGSDSDIETNSLFDMVCAAVIFPCTKWIYLLKAAFAIIQPSSKSSSTNKSPILSEELKMDVTVDRKRKSDSPESLNKKQKIDDNFNNK